MIVFCECNVFALSLLALPNVQTIRMMQTLLEPLAQCRRSLFHCTSRYCRLCCSVDFISPVDYIYFIVHRYL
jgi:hypothetical protein